MCLTFCRAQRGAVALDAGLGLTWAPMVSTRRSLAAALLAAASLLATLHGDALAAPRIMGSSVSIEPKRFEARVLVEDDPGNEVARVVFALTPRCAADPATSKYASVPEVTVTTSTPQGTHRAFVAKIDDPSGGSYGAWTVRATALDRTGTVIGRHQTVVVRTFDPTFRTLAFDSPPKGGTPTLDTSSGAATARLVADLDHDAPITSFGLVTSAHDSPAFGYSRLPGAMASDRAAGATPSITSRVESAGPTRLVTHFGFPAGTPSTKLAVKRMFMTDARCRTAELAPPQPLSLAVTSTAPRAMPLDVRIDGKELAKGRLVVRFRLRGPAPRTAPAPEIGGQKAPLVTVNLMDGSKVIGSTAARPVPSTPMAEAKWDGESMATNPITLPSGPTALGEALKKGLSIEIDDGGKPLAPPAVVRAR